MKVTHPPELKGLATSIQATLARVFGDGTADYGRFLPAAELQWEGLRAIMSGMRPTPLSDYIAAVKYNRERSLALLREAVRTLRDDGD